MMGASVAGQTPSTASLGLAPRTSVMCSQSKRKYVIARKAEKAITGSYIRLAIKKSFTGHYRGSLLKKKRAE
jgi:hypothetical protein